MASLRAWHAAVILLFAAAGTFVGAPYPREMILHHLATTAGVLLLLLLSAVYGFSGAAIGSVAIFLLLHILGARYIYSYVPYDEWLNLLTGFSPGEYFGFQRNHYDRFVHLAFGFLMVRPVGEMLLRHVSFSSVQAAVAIVFVVIGLSFFYELIEWGVAMALSPRTAESFNGQQGDHWDAHKDMALALFGTLLGLPLFRPRSRPR